MLMIGDAEFGVEVFSPGPFKGHTKTNKPAGFL